MKWRWSTALWNLPVSQCILISIYYQTAASLHSFLFWSCRLDYNLLIIMFLVQYFTTFLLFIKRKWDKPHSDKLYRLPSNTRRIKHPCAFNTALLWVWLGSYEILRWKNKNKLIFLGQWYQNMLCIVTSISISMLAMAGDAGPSVYTSASVVFWVLLKAHNNTPGAKCRNIYSNVQFTYEFFRRRGLWDSFHAPVFVCLACILILPTV